jgi:hypothetical protein
VTLPSIAGMSRKNQARDESHYRESERIMLLIDSAARKASDAARELERDGAEAHLVAALDTAAGALRADHKRLMQTVYWHVPKDQERLSGTDEEKEDQERLAV